MWCVWCQGAPCFYFVSSFCQADTQQVDVPRNAVTPTLSTCSLLQTEKRDVTWQRDALLLSNMTPVKDTWTKCHSSHKSLLKCWPRQKGRFENEKISLCWSRLQHFVFVCVVTPIKPLQTTSQRRQHVWHLTQKREEITSRSKTFFQTQNADADLLQYLCDFHVIEKLSAI